MVGVAVAVVAAAVVAAAAVVVAGGGVVVAVVEGMVVIARTQTWVQTGVLWNNTRCAPTSGELSTWLPLYHYCHQANRGWHESLHLA